MRSIKLLNRKWLFPAFLFILILLALILDRSGLLGFDFALLPLLLGGGFITYHAIISIIENKKITADMLVVLALIGSVYTNEYLAGAIVALMMISGEFLENMTLEKTQKAINSMVKLIPNTATVYRDGSWQTVNSEELLPGELILVKPGERIIVDGIIEKGFASIDESALTGESMPIEKETGDTVFAGTLNLVGAIEVRINKIGSESVLGRIIKIIYEAQRKKGKTQKVADRFAQYFVPFILSVCTLVWIFTYDLTRVMSVLVIACPCALVLATPTAVIASIGNAIRKCILIKSGSALETAARIDTLIFDKTGTITQGKPSVVDVIGFDGLDPDQILKLAASVEYRSEHPIAKAIMNEVQKRGLSFSYDESFEQIPGVGVRSKDLYVGNFRVLEYTQDKDSAINFMKDYEQKGCTVLFVLKDQKLVGCIAISDTIRPEISSVISHLISLKIKRIIMLTGDNDRTASEIAKQAGINEYEAFLLPEDKLVRIRKLQEQNYIVAMVGDGLNDAPALVFSDLGIAIGSAGTDVAIESSDIVIMNDDLRKVLDVLTLGKYTLKIIKQNIWIFAVGINAVGISLASSGLLSPVASAIIHNISSFLVILNSARILSFR